MIHVPGGTEWDGTYFITIVRMTHNLKLINYIFLEFSI